jgi:GntR family transcriptional regulator
MNNNQNPLSLRDRRPLYMQAIDAITGMIHSGELKTGSQLPPEEEFADQLGISRSTLREALGHLETRGYIARRQGVGTFVTSRSTPGFFGGLQRLEPFSKLAEAAEMDHSKVESEVSLEEADQHLAALLDAPVGTRLVRVQTIEAIDGIRCVYFDDYFIYREGLEQELDQQQSVLTYMFDLCCPPLSHTRSEIFAIEADQDVAKKLNIGPGKPVFHLEETYFDTDGGIIGGGLMYFVTDRFRFYITRRAARDIAED